MGKEEYITVFLGKYGAISKCRFPPYQKGWDYVRANPYPMGFLRWLFNTIFRKKDQQILGNVAEDTPQMNFQVINPFTKQVTEQVIKVVFCDPVGNDGRYVFNNIPLANKYEQENIKLKSETNFLFSVLMNNQEFIRNHVSTDLAEKMMFNSVSISKKLNDMNYRPNDYGRLNGNRQ